MENEHGFSASKVGYERQLKKWGLRKNQKHENLKLIKCRLEASQQQGRDIEVYAGGRKLEVQKQVDRCFITVLEKYKLERAKTPPGLVFVTKESGRSRELPWQFFVRQLNSINNLEMIINMPEDMLRDMVHVPSFYPNPSPQVPENLQQLIHYLSAIMPMDLDEEIMDFLRKIFSGDYRIATIEFLKLAVYVLSNKLLDHRTMKGYTFCEKLLRWFQMRHNYRFLQSILAQKTPTIEAFMESIFASTVYDEDGHLLEMSLNSGSDPNIAIKSCFETNLYTITALDYFAQRDNVHLARKIIDKGASVNFNNGAALIHAARHGSIEVVKLLIEMGVDVNKRRSDGPYYVADSALQVAASKGNLGIARMLLDNGAEINATSTSSGCPLSLAAKAGSMDLVETLLDRADINCRPVEEGDTPIQAAARTDSHALVKRLLQMGAEANARAFGWRGRTALQWACANGNLEMSRTLILAGADVNAVTAKFVRTIWGRYFIEDEDRFTALIDAATSNNHQLVSFLLENGADVNDSRAGRTALETAARSGNFQMVQLLLSAGAEPKRDKSISKAIATKDMELIRSLITAGAEVRGSRGTKALCAAVRTGDVELVHLLLSLGAHPNRGGDDSDEDGDDEDGATPLLCAVERASLPMVDALLKAGADCNQVKIIHWKWDRSLNALQMASVKGDSEIVKRLLDSGACINWPAGVRGGRTALQAAVEFGDIKLIQFLLRRNGDINASPAEGWGVTVLQAAVLHGKVELVRFLLEAGAEPNSVSPKSEMGPPLQIAAGKGGVPLVQLLLAYGADVNLVKQYCDDDGCRTALQAAARHGHYEIVELLLREGAHVHAANAKYNGINITPLQAAARGGYIRIAKVLLGAGADVNELGNEDEFTALESAALNGRIDMIKLLLDAGADITSELGRDTLERALEKAERCGHNAAAKFLKSHQTT